MNKVKHWQEKSPLKTKVSESLTICKNVCSVKTLQVQTEVVPKGEGPHRGQSIQGLKVKTRFWKVQLRHKNLGFVDL